MSKTELIAILSPIISVIIAVIMIRSNSKDTRRLVRSVLRIAKTQIDLNIRLLELDIKHEQLYVGQEQAKADYFSKSYLARFQKNAADLLNDKFDRYEEPMLNSKMHQDYLVSLSSKIVELEKLREEL